MKKLLDHIGIVISCTCMAHCIILPFLLLWLQFNVPEVPYFHQLMIGLTALVSGHAFYHGWKKHCRHIVLFFGGLGVLCMSVALIGSETFEATMTSIGGLAIITGHFINIKSSKACCNTHKC